MLGELGRPVARAAPARTRGARALLASTAVLVVSATAGACTTSEQIVADGSLDRGRLSAVPVVPPSLSSTSRVPASTTTIAAAPPPTDSPPPPPSAAPQTTVPPPPPTTQPAPPPSPVPTSAAPTVAAMAAGRAWQVLGDDELSWTCRIDETSTADRDIRYRAFADNLSQSGLPEVTIRRIANQLPLIDANMWAYCGAERATGVPALVLAAIHYREANNDPNRSIMSGEALGAINPDTHQIEPTALGDNAVRAASHLRAMAASVYGIRVRRDMTPAELAYAALSYNRGSMYCRGEANGVGELHPMSSPYVSNGLFPDTVDMEWPDVGGASVGSPEAWGEPASVRGRPDVRPGVYTVLRGLGSEIGIQPYEWNTAEPQIRCR